MSDETTVHNERLDKHFTNTYNFTPADERLSWGAKGLLWYILTRDEKWSVKVWQLASIFAGDKRGNGVPAIRGFIKELRDADYIVYRKYQNDKGQWQHSYHTYPMPFEKFKIMFPDAVKPHMAKPHVDEPHSAKPHILPRKDLPRKELPRKELLPEVVVSLESEVEEKTPSATIAPGEQKVNTPSPEKVVVVSSIFQEIGGDADSWERLLKLYTPEQINAAAEVAKSQGTRPDIVFGWIRDCIEKGWKPKASSEANAQANAKWWYENHHKNFNDRTIAYTTITTCNKYVEFARQGAANNVQCIEYTDPNFQARIKGIISELIQLQRRHE